MTRSDPPRREALDQPLPSDVALGGDRWWISYRSFPVFSPPWLARRTLLLGTAIFLWASLMFLLQLAGDQDSATALSIALYTFVAFFIISTAGPGLATLVRRVGLSGQTERWLVVAAIIAGLVLSGMADFWSSSRIETLLGTERSPDRLSAGALIFNLGVLLGIYLLLGGGLALAGYLIEGRRLRAFRQKEAMQQLQRQKLESDLQLSLLQAQVEPHFLFNSLAAIRSDLRDSPERAEAVLDALCGYLRSTIPRFRRTDSGALSSLGDQLDICESYLAVMSLRMDDRLSYDLDVPDTLRSQPFPPLMLISLVENAIKHGIEPATEGGRVVVRAREREQTLVIDVLDDGVGFSTGVGSGIGLTNIREQLKVRYAGQASLELASRNKRGVRARLVIPRESLL